VFAVGIYLSFIGYFVLTTSGGIIAQLLARAAGHRDHDGGRLPPFMVGSALKSRPTPMLVRWGMDRKPLAGRSKSILNV
jgi:hypothetical protein